jgi:hypothetical protein
MLKSSKIFLFVLAFLLPTLSHASILDVTNTEKLQLATSTPIGQKVKVNDGFILSGGAELAKTVAFWAAAGTYNGKPRYVRSDSDVDTTVIRWIGGKWNIAEVDGNGLEYDSTEDTDFPWQVTVWKDFNNGDIVADPQPLFTYPAIQQLSAPSTAQGGVFVSGGMQDGIYTHRPNTDNYGLVGISDNDVVNGFASIRFNGNYPNGWEIISPSPDGVDLYYSLDNVATPDLATSWKDPTAPPKFVIDLNTLEDGHSYGSAGNSNVAIISIYPDFGNLDDSHITWDGSDAFAIIGTSDSPTKQQIIDKMVSLGGGLITDLGGLKVQVAPTDANLVPLSFDGMTGSGETSDSQAANITVSSITQGELDAGVIVAGAGTTIANGTWVQSSTEAPQYTKLGYKQLGGDVMFWNGTDKWLLNTPRDCPGCDQTSYESADNTAFPWEATFDNSSPANGDNPAPTLSRNDIASESNWSLFTQVPTSLSFSVEPTSATTSTAISPSVAVEVLDQDGDLIETATNTISFSLNNNIHNASISGGVESTVDGVATFNNLSIDKAGSYTLTASASGLTSTTSASFNILSNFIPTPPPSNSRPVSGGGGNTGGPPSFPTSPTPPANPPPDCQSGFNFSSLTGKSCQGFLPMAPIGTFPVGGVTFTKNLTIGSDGEDVRALQVFLNTHGFPVSLTGPGSTGNETNFFGLLTKAALAKFQAANGISPALGYFGPITRGIILSYH